MLLCRASNPAVGGGVRRRTPRCGYSGPYSVPVPFHRPEYVVTRCSAHDSCGLHSLFLGVAGAELLVCEELSEPRDLF